MIVPILCFFFQQGSIPSRFQYRQESIIASDNIYYIVKLCSSLFLFLFFFYFDIWTVVLRAVWVSSWGSYLSRKEQASYIRIWHSLLLYTEKGSGLSDQSALVLYLPKHDILAKKTPTAGANPNYNTQCFSTHFPLERVKPTLLFPWNPILLFGTLSTHLPRATCS